MMSSISKHQKQPFICISYFMSVVVLLKVVARSSTCTLDAFNLKECLVNVSLPLYCSLFALELEEFFL